MNGNDTDAERATKGIQDVINGIRKTFTMVYPCHSPTIDRWFRMEVGSSIPIEVNASFIRGDTGAVTGIIGTTRDITKRKQAETALKESEERFKALHNASFGGIAIHDNGLILECNKGLSEITGYAYHELIGMDGLSLIRGGQAK